MTSSWICDHDLHGHLDGLRQIGASLFSSDHTTLTAGSEGQISLFFWLEGLQLGSDSIDMVSLCLCLSLKLPRG